MNLNRTSLRWLYWKLRKWKGKKRNPKNHRTGRREFPLCPLQASGQTGKIVTTIIFARRLFRSAAFKLSILFSFTRTGCWQHWFPTFVRAHIYTHARGRILGAFTDDECPKAAYQFHDSRRLSSGVWWCVGACVCACERVYVCVRDVCS